MKSRVFVVDDEQEYLALIEAFSAALLVQTVKLDHWSDETLVDMTENDLLLLDIHMPEVDGIDVLVRLADQCFKGGIVLMTGSDAAIVESVTSLAKKLELNLIGALRKPFRLASFKRLLDDFLSTHPNQRRPADEKPVMSVGELKDIIENEYFYPMFQPQVSASDQFVEGVECLTRLSHGVSAVPIPVFIESLAEHDLIHEFTLKLISKTFTEVGSLLREHPNLQISFNIDAMSLTKSRGQEIIEAVSNKGIALNRITFELTESNAIRIDSEALYSVSKMRSCGVNLSIDDFGTGYSTIQSLTELPFNELKLDRSLISIIESNNKAIEIIRAMQMLSENIGFRLVCEGVETKKQLAHVSSVGCDCIQGYYYSKPLSPENLRAFISTFDDAVTAQGA